MRAGALRFEPRADVCGLRGGQLLAGQAELLGELTLFTRPGFARVVEARRRFVELGPETVLLVAPLEPRLFEGLSRLPQLVEGRLPLADQPPDLGPLRGQLFLAPADLPGKLLAPRVQGMDEASSSPTFMPSRSRFGVRGCELLSELPSSCPRRRRSASDSPAACSSSRIRSACPSRSPCAASSCSQ